MEPFFSIITVCLDAGNNLLNTINTVLSQDYNEFEIIVKDGFSKDNSYEKLQCDKRIVKVQEKDYGIYDAMNQALEHVKGQYVLFLNAGDFFSDNSVLSSFYETIIRNNFPDLIYCDYKTTGLNEYVQSPSNLTNFYLFRTMLCHQVCMVKKELYDRIGIFDTNYKVDADYDFLLRLVILNKAKHSHIPRLGIISTSKGFSFQNKDLAKKEVKLIRKKYFPHTYLFYVTLYALTLPSFREKLANHPSVISKFYQRLVNVINRSF